MLQTKIYSNLKLFIKTWKTTDKIVRFIQKYLTLTSDDMNQEQALSHSLLLLSYTFYFVQLAYYWLVFMSMYVYKSGNTPSIKVHLWKRKTYGTQWGDWEKIKREGDRDERGRAGSG